MMRVFFLLLLLGFTTVARGEMVQPLGADIRDQLSGNVTESSASTLEVTASFTDNHHQLISWQVQAGPAFADISLWEAGVGTSLSDLLGLSIDSTTSLSDLLGLSIDSTTSLSDLLGLSIDSTTSLSDLLGLSVGVNGHPMQNLIKLKIRLMVDSPSFRDASPIGVAIQNMNPDDSESVETVIRLIEKYQGRSVQ